MKALDLRPDGTIVIRDGTREWTLRRPKIGEWGQLVEEVERTDDRIRDATLDEQGQPLDDLRERLRRQTRVIRGTADQPPAYATCIASMIRTLDGGEVDISELPVWCTSADAVTEILGHWRAVPLDLSPMAAG